MQPGYWRDALDAGQQRHPLLSVYIDTAFNRVPHFRRVTSERIPLRVVTSAYARWQRELAEEVNTPFAPDQAPLFRAVLLHQDAQCTFILSSHHAVCDGASRIFLLRDILLALSGHVLEALPLAPSRESLFGARQRTSSDPGLPFGGGEISIAPGGSMEFWELARFAKDGLSAVKNTENISRMIDLRSKAVSSNLTVEQAFQLKRNAFNAQVMLTNLGRLPFDSIFGPLKLESLWAPCALRGIEGEQTVGAVTVNGSLHLTRTSPAPISGLLAGMEEELRKACAVQPIPKT